MDNPAEFLEGLILEEGWLVEKKLEYGEDHTGGNFSVCYRVKKGSQIAFLKATDISRASKSSDPMKVLLLLTSAYEYEKELLQLCDGKKMDRVVRILGSGTITPTKNNPKELFVPYLIFELADTTIREHVLEISDIMDNACLMRSLHSVAVAISQLHGGGIVHQDIKGSNILLFDVKGYCKLADLGRAEASSKKSIFFDDIISGDPDYAPPEQILGYVDGDWDIRRKGTDLYHLGSLICFYYTQMTMTGLYKSYLPVEFIEGKWHGRYKEVQSYLKAAFQEVLEYIQSQLEEKFSDRGIATQITKMVKFLCDPDPSKRGHPDNLPAERYSMIRFVTAFDKLATQFELKLL